MKRSNINRYGSSASSNSAMVESLEPRQLFCYAPLNMPVGELAKEAVAEQPLASSSWQGLGRAEQTSGSTGLTGAGHVS